MFGLWSLLTMEQRALGLLESELRRCEQEVDLAVLRVCVCFDGGSQCRLGGVLLNQLSCEVVRASAYSLRDLIQILCAQIMYSKVDLDPIELVLCILVYVSQIHKSLSLYLNLIVIHSVHLFFEIWTPQPINGGKWLIQFTPGVSFHWV